MENDAIPIGANTQPVKRSHWKRSLIELNGRPERNYIRQVSPLLLQSYAEIGAFPHEYNTWDLPCRTHTRRLSTSDMLHRLYSGSASDYTNFRQSMDSIAFHVLQTSLNRVGVSALEFNPTGTCLASATRSGCLTMHEFASLSSHGKDGNKQLLHISLSEGSISARINVVRWNPFNGDEIAYTSQMNSEVCIFDMSNPSRPVEELRRQRHGVGIYDNRHISDIAFLNGDTRVLASDTWGLIRMWDRRVSNLPQTRLATYRAIDTMPIGLTSIQLLGDQYVYGAGNGGSIYIWDLRGGRSSAALQSDKEVYSFPLTSVNLASMLNDIRPLKAQLNIRPREIQTININPSCPYQLGFHLEDGCSGVLDMHNFLVSHIHCPDPSPWVDGPYAGTCVLVPRKPSWIPKHSIYVAPSTSSNGLQLLDFYPHPGSPCYVDYDDSKSTGKSTVERKQSVFVPLSKRVTACAIHPLNDTIVAGTMASLLVISQKHLCKKGDGDAEHS